MDNQDWDPLAHIPAARAIITRSRVCLIYMVRVRCRVRARV